MSTFGWLHLQKTVVKKEVKKQISAGIDKNDLLLLTFSKREARTRLRWEHSSEFEYKDQMYDVVETWTLGDTVYYWCWLDHKETKLNKQLKELADRASGKSKKIREKNERFIPFVKSLYFAGFFRWNGSAPECLREQVSYFSDSYSSITIRPPTPPPQLM